MIPGNVAGAAMGVLGSKWDGLSDHLIARIYEVNSKGESVGGPVVRAPFSGDVSLDIDLSWTSPFEGAGAESSAPALSAGIQSGSLAAIFDRLGEAVGVEANGVSGALKESEGRSGMTKLNSTQIFTGMPPLRIQGELLFRAWSDPLSEVEAPIDQLMAWAMPKKLAEIGTMITAAAEYATSDKGLIESMLPSEVPSLLAVTYKGRTYGPVVIERINMPISSPVDSAGRFTQMKMPLTIASLRAWDRDDWAKSRRSL